MSSVDFLLLLWLINIISIPIWFVGIALIKFWTRRRAGLTFRPIVKWQEIKWDWLLDDDWTGYRGESLAIGTTFLLDGIIMLLILLFLITSPPAVYLTVGAILAVIFAPRYVLDKLEEDKEND